MSGSVQYRHLFSVISAHLSLTYIIMWLATHSPGHPVSWLFGQVGDKLVRRLTYSSPWVTCSNRAGCMGSHCLGHGNPSIVMTSGQPCVVLSTDWCLYLDTRQYLSHLVHWALGLVSWGPSGLVHLYVGLARGQGFGWLHVGLAQGQVLGAKVIRSRAYCWSPLEVPWLVLAAINLNTLGIYGQPIYIVFGCFWAFSRFIVL